MKKSSKASVDRVRKATLECHYLLWLLRQASEEPYSGYVIADLLSRVKHLRLPDQRAVENLGLKLFAKLEIEDEELMKRLASNPLTVLVLAIKPRELKGILGFLGIRPTVDNFDRDIDGYRVWRFERPFGQLFVSMVGEERGSSLAAATRALFPSLSPDFAALCGVAAGHPEHTSLCDVVVGERLLEFDGGKETIDKIKPRPETETPGLRRLKRDIAFFETIVDGIPNFAEGLQKLNELKYDLPSEISELSPTLKPGTIATGALLRADPEIWRLLEDSYDERTRAIDQESWEFGRQCNDEGIPGLVFRGISDFGTEESLDGGPASGGTQSRRPEQVAAAMAAAATALHFVETSVVPKTGSDHPQETRLS